MKEPVRVKGRVTLVLRDAKTGKIKRVETTENIVTNDGDLYYAQMGAGETPTNDFGAATSQINALDNTGAAPAKASNFSNIGSSVGSSNPAAFTSGYPKTNDGDADNTGAGTDVVSYAVNFGTAAANGTISRVAIHLTGATGTDPLLMYATLGASVTKTSSDTLKIFVNHTMNGV